MRIVIVNMKDYIFADAVAQSLQADKKVILLFRKRHHQKKLYSIADCVTLMP